LPDGNFSGFRFEEREVGSGFKQRREGARTREPKKAQETLKQKQLRLFLAHVDSLRETFCLLK
jgi:hypothetical protein